MIAMRSDSGNGSGWSSTLWTTENSAVLAPIHTASVSTAVSVKTLSFHSRRNPTRRSFNTTELDGGSTFQVQSSVRSEPGTRNREPGTGNREPGTRNPGTGNLFRSKRDRRIDAGRAPGRNEIRDRRYAEQQPGRGQPGHRISGSNPDRKSV